MGIANSQQHAPQAETREQPQKVGSEPLGFGGQDYDTQYLAAA